MNNKGARFVVITLAILIGGLLLMNGMGLGVNGSSLLGTKVPKEVSFSEFTTYVTSGRVETADWQQNRISGDLKDGTKYTVRAVNPDTDQGANILTSMEKQGVRVKLLEPPLSQSLMPFIGMILIPILVMVAIFYFFYKQSQSGGSQAMNFGRSRAKRAGENSPKITFADVAGIDEAKEELAEIVDFLRNTKKYTALGAKIPKGVLLTGPPGVGKTHLARAIAGEAGVPFYHISGSDFVEMFVGVGAARVRDLFETAKAHRPSLIFIDEIDAVGRQRGAGLGGGHDEREQTLNQLLVEMDGFEANSGVIMIAATNRPDVLDPALLRPGRFDRQVTVDAPDAAGREAILKIHSKGKPYDESINLATLAKRTPGFTGADLANTLNEAALLAARRNQSKISQSNVEEAVDRVLMGPARKSRIMDDTERKTTAYHEAGHAIVQELIEHIDPVHKVTILPRGNTLGVMMSLPEKDRHQVTKSELEGRLAAALGGRVAEDIVFGEVTTGASSDLQYVTRIARAMVTQYGMSERIGTLTHGRTNSSPFMGRDYYEDRDYSEEVAKIIDEEVRSLIDTAKSKAEEILTIHRDKLDAVAAALLEHETLDHTQLVRVMNGEKLEPVVLSTELPQSEEENSASDDSSDRKVSNPPITNPDPA